MERYKLNFNSIYLSIVEEWIRVVIKEAFIFMNDVSNYFH